MSLHLPLREQGPIPPGRHLLCTLPSKLAVSARLQHLTAMQSSPELWHPTHYLDHTQTSNPHSVLNYKKQKQGLLDTFGA